MGRKVYDLLSIDVVSSWRSRAFFKREESEDSFSLHLTDGLPELKRRMQALLKDGVIFNNCIFTGHGNSGVIWLGSDTITRHVWYQDFYGKGYDRLFPFKNARLGYAGGSAFGWTSSGFGSPISGHERHLWGDTKAVMVLAGGGSLRYFRNWNLITDNAGLPIRPDDAHDPTGY